MSMSSESKQIVQIGLGQAVVLAIQSFALSDIESVDTLKRTLFKEVKDSDLKTRLAETLFGARWLYKLGLVTLASGEQRAAHVRAQIIDYSAICEALLLDAIAHGIANGHLTGAKWALRNGKPYQWAQDDLAIRSVLRKERKFVWLIEICKDEGISQADLHWLRKRRNSVHVAEMAALNEKVYINTSRKAYKIMLECVFGVVQWMRLHR